MPLHAIFFLVVVIAGWIISILSNPFVGLLTYIYIYFNIPAMYWWGIYLPNIRWSLLAAIVLWLSILLHFNKYKLISPFKVPFLRWLVFLFLLMLIVSIFAVYPKISLKRCYDFFRYLVISYSIYIIINNFKEIKIYLLFFLTLVFFLSYLAHYYFTGTRLDGIGLVDAIEANDFSILLLTTIPIALYFLFCEKFYYKLFSILALISILDAFAMCRSRGGFLAVATMIFYLSLKFSTPKYRWKILIGSSILITLLISLMDPYYIHRILTIQNDPSGGSGRLEIWMYGLKMAKDHIYGAGGGAFMLLSPEYIPERLLNKALYMRASHNTFLMILVEQGFLGLIIYGIALLDLFITSHRIKKLNIQKPFMEKIKVLNLLLTSSIIGFLVASIFADRLYYEGFYLIAMLIPVNLKIIKGEIQNGI